MVDWHPILATREFEPGRWVMFDTMERPYAIVVMLEVGGERGYRAVTYAVQSRDRQLVGYYRTLMSAVMAAHRWFIAQHGGAHDSKEYGRVR